MRALVVDDSRAIRVVIGRLLKELGFEVVEAGNGREALARLHESRPDVILVDWNMPEMNGFEFLVAVREEAAFTDVPLMMVTTETEVNQMSRALEAGANEYVMKPFSREALVEKLSVLGVVQG